MLGRVPPHTLFSLEAGFSTLFIIHSCPSPFPPAGSCTACVIVLNGSTLVASNLGDSGFIIVRGGLVHEATTQQQHKFNFPYQVRVLGFTKLMWREGGKGERLQRPEPEDAMASPTKRPLLTRGNF